MTPSMERIYIGGLRPPHLTVDHLLERLEQSLGSVVEFRYENPGPIPRSSACYVHVNATVKQQHQHQQQQQQQQEPSSDNHADVDIKKSMSALEHVAKMYHNVTWKGCKLKVEAARPHFLQRLEREIQERSAACISTNTHDDSADEDHPPPTFNRRHLKIRKRYGEQVFTVDTKPYAVDSWKGMQQLQRKIDRRKIHYQQERLNVLHNIKAANHQTRRHPADVRTQSKLNRAVHLTFSHAEDQNNNNHQEADDEKSLSSDSIGLSSADTSQDTSSTGEDSTNDHRDLTTATPKPKYVWSSSSSSSTSEDDSESTKSSEQHTLGKETNTRNHDHDHAPSATSSSSTSSNSDDDDDDDARISREHDCHQFIDKGENTKGPPSNHDIEYSDKNVDLGSKGGEKNMKKAPSEWDQFEAAMPTVGDIHDNTGDEDNNDAHYFTDVTEGESGSLLKDVEVNLSILASLFPDMETIKPRKVVGDQSDSAKMENATNKASQSGWSASGIMLRYDPRLDLPTEDVERAEPKNDLEQHESAVDTSSEESDSNDEQVEARAEESTKSGEDDSSDGTSSDGTSSDGASEGSTRKLSLVSNSNEDNKNTHDNADVDTNGKKAEPMQRQAPEGNIYRQQKLEALFREAREGSLTVKPEVTTQPSGVTSSTSGAFSFGFDLSPEPSTTAGSFAFSFFPSPPAQDKKGILAENDSITGGKELNPFPTQIEPDTSTHGSIQEPHLQIPSFRRRCIFFPKDVLDRYQEDFYVMNDGLKILQDLERYHKDEEVQAHWKMERQSLTQDWKRKRKYAQQARTKHQKSYKQQRR